jgi:hypothetical protein
MPWNTRAAPTLRLIVPFARLVVCRPYPLGLGPVRRWDKSVEPPEVAGNITDGDLPVVPFLCNVRMQGAIYFLAEARREVLADLLPVHGHVLNNKADKGFASFPSFSRDKNIAYRKGNKLDDHVEGGKASVCVELCYVLRKPLAGILRPERGRRVEDVPERHSNGICDSIDFRERR